MKKLAKSLLIAALFITAAFIAPPVKNRRPVDPVGFATTARQMDQVMARINVKYGPELSDIWKRYRIEDYSTWKTVICPHDDYIYAGWLYPSVLRNIKAGTVILIGVAHKAKQFNVEDKLVFDSYDSWVGPYGAVKVSLLRDRLTNMMPRSEYTVNDSLQQAEHSLEAMIPFLQFYNKQVQIVPILVPCMTFERMKTLAFSLSSALFRITQEHDLLWARDYAIVISSDAVHYGCEGWGSSDYGFYGCDSTGYLKAVEHENQIVNTCLTGAISKDKIQEFTRFTVQDTNYRSYKWTWCGRYSVPFGLLTTYFLAGNLRSGAIKGTLLEYSTSVSHDTLRVSDLGMGRTAPANLKHWVGYAAVGYK